MKTTSEVYNEMAKSGSLRRWKACKELLHRWKAAGCPSNYKENQDGTRIMDLPARKEALADRANPITAKLRKLRGELLYKLRLKRLER